MLSGGERGHTMRSMPALAGPVLLFRLGLGQLERGGVRREVDVLVDGVEGLRCAEDKRQRFVVNELVDAVGDFGLLELGRLGDQFRVERLEAGDDGAGAVLAGLADEGAVQLERRPVGDLRALLLDQDVPFLRPYLLCQTAPGIELRVARAVDSHVDFRAERRT